MILVEHSVVNAFSEGCILSVYIGCDSDRWLIGSAIVNSCANICNCRTDSGKRRALCICEGGIILVSGVLVVVVIFIVIVCFPACIDCCVGLDCIFCKVPQNGTALVFVPAGEGIALCLRVLRLFEQAALFDACAGGVGAMSIHVESDGVIVRDFTGLINSQGAVFVGDAVIHACVGAGDGDIIGSGLGGVSNAAVEYWLFEQFIVT